MRIKSLLITISFIFIISCEPKHVPADVSKIINLAGENGKELKSAILHYRHAGDSLKLKALYYLIRHMENDYSYYGEALDKYEPFFDQPTGDHNSEWDNFTGKFGNPDISQCEAIYDYKNISADFLINNIDQAFYVWQHFPWCKELSFNTFCDYILPYRCGNEHLTEGWRDTMLEKYEWLLDSVKNNPTMANAYSFLYRDINSWMNAIFNEYPINLSLEKLLEFKDGSCHDETNLYLYACRAMGITIESDYLPGWGKRKQANHRWHILVNENGDRLVMNENKLYPIDSIQVDASYFTLDSVGRRYIPSEYQVLESKGITKVFRMMYPVLPDALAVVNKEEEEIPDFFQSPFIKDVTSEYIPCKDLSIHEINTDNKYAYLCVFSSFSWSAHNWAKILDNSAVFKDMGFDALYLPAVYAQNKFIPVAYPFILDSVGNSNSIIPDHTHKQTLRLDRKYPLFANIVNFANKMIGGRFEIANNPDFSDATTVYNIVSTPLYIQDFTIEVSNFRYLRYVAPADRQAELAELSVECDNGSGYSPIQCKAISDVPGVEYNGVTSNAEKIIDNNLESYFITKNLGGWVGLDLGPAIEVNNLKVKYCPRNDDNIVTPGRTYELRYWDNAWISIEFKKADNYWIEFDDVPKNAVYWLHCLNGGTEERIFTVNEEGNILWW